MERREATAEASFAAMRERRRLGMAMAATIRMTETTTNNSIREKPVCFERIAMNSLRKCVQTTLRLPGCLEAEKPHAHVHEIVHVFRKMRLFLLPQACAITSPALPGATFLSGLPARRGA